MSYTVNVQHVESYAAGVAARSFDKDLAADDAADVANLLTLAVQRAIDFGHVNADSIVARHVLQSMMNREDVGGTAAWGPNIGRAREIIDNI